ncbi:hypothetical protein RV10_GL005103 [Enterococcus pallens]|nr:hypothetical protein RV10_GL005103 [Enterococcus pallens]
MYEKWCEQTDNEGKVYHNMRIKVLCDICHILTDMGYPNIYIDPFEPRYLKSSFVPYIFTHEEIIRLFDNLKKIVNQKDYSNDAFTLLFILYYSCGLRRSEGLHLRKKHCKVDQGIIEIIDSKNHISRIIPLSDSVHAQLQSYMTSYSSHLEPNQFIFHHPNSYDEHYSIGSLYRRYRKLLVDSYIPYRQGGNLPRIHDLRHTFAIHALEKAEKEGIDLYAALPLLSVYLGHEHLTQTENYLRLTVQQHKNVSTKVKKYIGNLFYQGEED